MKEQKYFCKISCFHGGVVVVVVVIKAFALLRCYAA